MDNQVITSLTGTTTPADKKKSAGNGGDADAFSQAMDDAVKAKGDGSKETEAFIHDGKSAEKAPGKDKARKPLTPGAEMAQQQASDKRHVGKLQNYLHNLIYKDPTTLSIAERQALQLGEFAQDKVDLGELQKMLHSKGLELRDLSFSQLAQLTSRSSRAQVSEVLDALLRERRVSEENRNEPGERASVEGPQQGSLERLLTQEAGAARENQKGELAQRQQHRQAVIDQILQHIQVRNLADQTEIQLKLNPEYLGDVRIRLVHGEEGIRAEFETTSRTTRQLLKESEEDLVATAQARGVRLDRVGVRLVEEVQ